MLNFPSSVLCSFMTKLEENLSKTLESKEAEIARLNEELAILKKALFGRKTERVIPVPENQLELALQFASNEAPEVEEPIKNKRKSRKGLKLSRFEIPDDLPREEIRIDISEEDKVCLETGTKLQWMRDEISEKLAYKPGSFYVKKFIRAVYCSTKASVAPVIAPLPDFPIEKCRADVSLLSHVLTMKFADHLPLYRVEEILKRGGIDIQRQTLCGWVLKLGEVLMPLYDLMFKKVLAGNRVFTDATGLNYLVKGKGSQKGYIWVYCGGETKATGKSPPYFVYEFTPDGKHRHPEKALNQFKGLLLSDAHRAYETAALREEIQWQPCLAHARRKFVEAESGNPKIKAQIIELFKKLFLNEREAWDMDAEQRLVYRTEKQLPIMNELYDMIKDEVDRAILPSCKFSKALMYMYSREKHFRTFLSDPMALIDNNLSERAIKPLVIGRKNWLFLGSKDSGKSTAVILSLVQTCRHLKIDPSKYLEDVLTRIMGHNSQKLDELLPDQWAELQK
jgi:transposase